MIPISITKKIWTSICILVLGFAITIAAGYLATTKTESQLEKISETTYPLTQYIQSAITAYEAQVKFYDDAYFMLKIEFIDKAILKAHQSQKALEKAMAIPHREPHIKGKLLATLNQMKAYTTSANTIYTKLASDIQNSNAATPPLTIDQKRNISEAYTIIHEALLNHKQAAMKHLEHEIAEISAATSRHRFTNIYVFFIVILVSLAIIRWIINHSIITPLNNTIEMIKEIAQGNGDLSKRLKINSKDELGELARWFNLFTEKLQNAFDNDNIETAISQRTSVLLAAKEKAEKAEDMALKAAKSKSDFLANMSHELRTPLNGIIGFAELLNESQLSDDQATYNSTVLRNSHTLLTLINDILDFSKIEAGMLTLEKINFDIRDITSDVLELFSVKVDHDAVSLSVRVQKSVPEIVNGDPERIKQILLNLMSNAVKFTEEGAITLTIRLVKSDVQYTWLHFSVKDTGIGIPQDKMLDVFSEFRQADNSTTRKYGGSGLGIPITANLIEHMGGLLAIDTEVDKGSDFYFVMKFENNIIDIQDQDEQKDETFAKQLTLDGLKILIVEDEEHDLIETICNNHGAQTTLARNGQEAVDILATTDFYDAVLMDIKMPVMNGIDATKEIRKTGNTLPIIALTANAFETDRTACMKAGMNNFLTKPTETQKLILTIINSIEHLKTVC